MRTGPDIHVQATPFGRTPTGQAVTLFTLTHAGGVRVRLMNYGGIVVSLEAPDRSGQPADVVLGCDTLDAYLAGHPYLGALIGRYANRIAGGCFVLDGVTYRLATNDGPHHLHGGIHAFDEAVWQATPVSAPQRAGVRLAHTSQADEEGYPGTLAVVVTYWLTAADELWIDYEATTDAPTPVNLTHHSYFNLAGHAAGDILNHEVQLHAECFTPVDGSLIPTGGLRPVAGTPFDFRRPTTIGARIDDDNEQLRRGRGYDHNWVLNRSGPGLVPAARVHEPASGRTLEVLTTEPGIQFYTGNFLDGSVVGKGGVRYGRRAGLCLETQHFPDSPNQPAFPSTILRPGERFTQTTVYRFSAG